MSETVLNYQKTRDDLVAAIPRLNSVWTNFNASDPGITLIELLVWVAQNISYQVNQSPRQSYRNFLRLLAGATASEVSEVLKQLKQPDQIINPGAPPPLYVDPDYIELLEFLFSIEIGEPIKTLKIRQKALDFYLKTFRAVTKEDFETLTVSATEPLPSDQPKIARAIATCRDDMINVYILPNLVPRFTSTWTGQTLSVVRQAAAHGPATSHRLASIAQKFLDPRRLAGSVVQVKPSPFSPISIRATILLEPKAAIRATGNTLAQHLERWLDPLTGGASGTGWEFNAPLTRSSISSVINEAPGVKYCEDLAFSSGQLQVGVFSTVGVTTWLSGVPVSEAYMINGVTELQSLELTFRRS